jgi:hypothetical protein
MEGRKFGGFSWVLLLGNINGKNLNLIDGVYGI